MADEAEINTETGVETQATTEAEAPPAKGAERAADGKFAKKEIEQADWREGLPDDLRKTADKFNSREEALKAYQNAEARISRSIVKPGKNATDEEKAAWQAALRRETGVPESLDDYKVDIPTAFAEDEQTMEGIKALLGEFHKLGVPPAAASYAIGVHEKLMEAQAGALVEEARQAMANSEVELRREWGKDYEANDAIATAALARYGDDDFVALQKMTGKELAEALGNRRLGDLAPLKRLFARVGRDTGESRTIFRQTSEGQDMRQQALDLKRTEAYTNTRHPDHARVRGQVQELLQRYTGEFGNAA